jgi:hypothetical protein
MDWVTVGRPGFSGKNRDKKHSAWDQEYGQGNWRTAWKWNGTIVTRDFAYQLYEDGYYSDSDSIVARIEAWKELLHESRDVYDIEERDVESGLDYLVQKGTATHLQDISVRRVVQRRGWKFEGDKLIQIRKHDTYFGDRFSPGRVRFHMPEFIENPRIESWWDHNSIEDFYQSNKVLQVKK